MIIIWDFEIILWYLYVRNGIFSHIKNNIKNKEREHLKINNQIRWWIHLFNHQIINKIIIINLIILLFFNNHHQIINHNHHHLIIHLPLLLTILTSFFCFWEFFIISLSQLIIYHLLISSCFVDIFHLMVLPIAHTIQPLPIII